MRLNEGGNRQEVRERIAATINAVAAPAGRRLAEVRSFKERGIDREPQRHEGPQVADKLAREPDRPPSPAAFTIGSNPTPTPCANAFNGTPSKAPA